MNETFKTGDVVVFIGSSGFNGYLTPGKKYKIVTSFGSYLRFIDDRGQFCDASCERFKIAEDEDETVFEVGETYTYINGFPDGFGVCKYAGKDVNILVYSDGSEVIAYHSDRKKFEVYKEPVKHIRYFNVYADGVENRPNASRKRADVVHKASQHNKHRIACVRVEFEEGVFDD